MLVFILETRRIGAMQITSKRSRIMHRAPCESALALVIAAVAVLTLHARTAEACYIPSNGSFVVAPSERDTTAPVLQEVTSAATLGEDGCGPCAGEHWVVTLDGQDTPAPESARGPAVGYRIEVLGGDVYEEPDFDIHTPETSRLGVPQSIVLFGDVDEIATIRITPIDRAGNEGQPVVHTLEAIGDTGACSTRGRSSGRSMLPLLAAILFAGRRRKQKP